MKVSDLYDTFFVNTEKDFKYIGCPDQETYSKLQELIKSAVCLLEKKNSGKYLIKNDINI